MRNKIASIVSGFFITCVIIFAQDNIIEFSTISLNSNEIILKSEPLNNKSFLSVIFTIEHDFAINCPDQITPNDKNIIEFRISPVDKFIIFSAYIDGIFSKECIPYLNGAISFNFPISIYNSGNLLFYRSFEAIHVESGLSLINQNLIKNQITTSRLTIYVFDNESDIMIRNSEINIKLLHTEYIKQHIYLYNLVAHYINSPLYINVIVDDYYFKKYKTSYSISNPPESVDLFTNADYRIDVKCNGYYSVTSDFNLNKHQQLIEIYLVKIPVNIKVIDEINSGKILIK